MIVPLLWIAAFVFSLPLVEPHAIARALSVTCALGAAGATVWQYGVPRLSPLVITAGLFWVLAAVSVVFSTAPYVSLMALATFSLMPLSALAFIAAPERALRVAAGGVGAVLGALALWAMAQHLFFTDMLVFGQVRHPFANPNSYAVLLALGVFPALGAAAGINGRGRAALMLLAALLAAAVMVIGGRSVALLLVLAGIVFFVMTRSGGAGRRAAVVLAVAVCAGVLLALAGDNPPIMRMLHGADGEAAGFGRLPLWQGAAAMFLDHPVAGTGIGTFALYYPAYRLSGDVASGGYMAHSDPLQFTAEMGGAAAVLFYAFIALCLLRMKKSWAGVSNKAWAAGCLCGLGILVVHSHVDFNFYTAPILCAAGLTLAAWYRAVDGGVVVPRLPVRAGALVVMTAFFVLMQGLFIAEHQIVTARTMVMNGDMDGFGAQVNAANKTGFGMNAQAYVMAATMPIGLMHGAPQADRPALYAQAMGLLMQAEKRNARLVAVPYYRAQVSALHQPDGEKTPEQWLRAALALNPQHTESRVLLGQRLRAAGDGDEAYAVLKAGLNWPYGTAAARDYYDELGAQALMRKDMETFNRMSAAARQLDERLALPLWMAVP